MEQGLLCVLLCVECVVVLVVGQDVALVGQTGKSPYRAHSISRLCHHANPIDLRCGLGDELRRTIEW